MKAREVRNRLIALGATETQAKGSHRKYEFGGCLTVVTFHPGDIPPGTLRSIERDMARCFGPDWLRRSR
ncbi:MAG: type II toxin-antitoxin system HicA family toxin [Chloroflexi bacterium]|nr:type II toxin-antitoxin system HicA family toxin [Chloroflexota bacterium]